MKVKLTDDKNENRRLALDTLKTWRSEVLPNLEPGMILYSNTMGGSGGKRDRIYTNAGFSEYSDNYGGQYGLVVTDENGNNTVVPVDPEDKTNKKKLKEQRFFVDCCMMELKEEQVDIIYRVLFS